MTQNDSSLLKLLFIYSFSTLIFCTNPQSLLTRRSVSNNWITNVLQHFGRFGYVKSCVARRGFWNDFRISHPRLSGSHPPERFYWFFPVLRSIYWHQNPVSYSWKFLPTFSFSPSLLLCDSTGPQNLSLLETH